jgi:hypothetical protein
VWIYTESNITSIIYIFTLILAATAKLETGGAALGTYNRRDLWLYPTAILLTT